MSCDNLVSAQDLENAKLDTITLAEIATSNEGGEASGDLIFTSTDRFGNVHLTSEGALARIESNPINGGVWAVGITFEAYNDYAAYNGVAYKPKLSTPLPYTTTQADATLDPNVEPFLLNQKQAAFTVLEAKQRTDLLAGDLILLTDRGNSLWNVVDASTVTPNELDIIINDAGDLAFVFSFKGVIKASEYGFVNDDSDQSGKWVQFTQYHVDNGGIAIVDVPFLCDANTATITDFDKLNIEFTERVRYTENCQVLVVLNETQNQITVNSITEEVWPVGATQSISVLNVADSSSYAASDITLIQSDDVYSANNQVQKAEQMRVLGVEAGKIYLHGLLSDTYTTTIQVSKLKDVDVNINMKCEGFGDIYSPSISVGANRSAMRADFITNSTINLDIKNGWGVGLSLRACWMTKSFVRAETMRNDTGNSSFGYGIEVCTSSRYCESTVLATACRHAYTTNTFLSLVNGEQSSRGAQRNNDVYGKHVNSTSAAWDTHPLAYNTTFHNCKAVWTHLRSVNPAFGTQRGFQDRAVNTVFRDPMYRGNGNVFLFGSKVSDYGEDYKTKIYNLDAEKMPEYTTSAVAFDFTGSNFDTQTVEFIGGTIEGTETLVSPSVEGLNVVLRAGFTAVDAGRVQVRTGQRLTLDGFTRRRTEAGTQERILVNNDAELSMLDYRLDLFGIGDASALILCQGAGSATVFIGSAYCNKQTSSFTYVAIDGSNTPNIVQGSDRIGYPESVFLDIDSVINRSDKYEGKFQFDTTNNIPRYSQGSSAGSGWADSNNANPLNPS